MLKLLKPASPEDLFIQRYDLLMGWALSLTGRERAQAEDLVHDAFIQFTLRRNDLGSIENTDAYLHRMLRNMYLSQVRRASWTHDSTFSIANYDSAELGLRSIDPLERVDVQEDLRQVCQYACLRKESSKAGCVLILRFFHSYYPSEIAQVLRITRKTVGRFLLIARRESKIYLNDPGALRFTVENPRVDITQSSYARTSSELLAELRHTIFHSRKGVCFQTEELKEIYKKNSSASVDLGVLGHLVTCPHCLDEVNRLLGLPLLSERNPDDKLGRETPPNDSGDEGGSGGSVVEAKKRYQRRLRETIEHRPQELRIAVNGFVLGAQQISSEFNKQVLSVNIDEPIGFVEVFSEQGVRLLFCDVDQPIDGSVEQTARAEFDCGRALDLSLSFRGPWPTLNVSYHDPIFEAVEFSAGDLDSETSPEIATDYAESKTRDSWSRPLTWVRSIVGDFDGRFFLRPAVVTALFSLIVLSAIFTVLYRRGPTQAAVSAADLLQRAVASEESITSNRDHVLHRTLRLEEKSATGQVISRHRVEIWQSAEKGIAARRLYDDNGTLVAGAWKRSDGVQTVYHHGTPPQLQIRNAQSAIRNFGDVWQIDPSAADFSALIENIKNASVQERDSTYMVNGGSDLRGSNGLIKASLVLGRSDLHAIEQTLVVRLGDEVREFTFVETSFERRSTSSVAPAVFEPDVQLVRDRATGRRGDTETVPSSPAPPISASPFLATPDLELQILKHLNQADAFYGEQISLTRTPEGRLRVQGIVETDKRKTELLQSLSSLRQNPAVQVQIETVTEAAARQARRPSSGEGVADVNSLQFEAKSVVPAESELRNYIARQNGLSGDALDQETRRYADRLMVHTRQARRHALALKQITERFSSDDLNALDQEAKNQWRTMIVQHSKAVEQELDALRRELQPVFPEVSSRSSESGVEISSDADFAGAAKRLFVLASSVDESVGRSFSIYAAGNTSVPIRTSEFVQSLSSATALAQRIARSQ